MEQTVGGTCAMILANVITQRIWAIYARKEDSLSCRYRLGHPAVYGCIHLGFCSVVRQDGLVIALLNSD